MSRSFLLPEKTEPRLFLGTIARRLTIVALNQNNYFFPYFVKLNFISYPCFCFNCRKALWRFPILHFGKLKK